MTATLILVGMATVVCLIAIVEATCYRRKLARIPTRIHVNGTRGKSSVTRLIAAGLRQGGIRTCAKTTGTLARMIFPDGRELPIFRPDRANVIEQKRVVRAAVDAKAEALVIECMALQPLLQSVCELRLVRSTHGVITNARADHLDVMGPTRLDVARALSATTPIAGTLFTAESRDDSLEVMAHACDDRESTLHRIGHEDAEAVTAQELSGFSYLEHAENVALALRVCESIGVDRSTALQGMWQATPDPGAMRVLEGTVGRSTWRFVNAFAANDPESTGQIWQAALGQHAGLDHQVVVMNCRVDRAERSRTLAAEAARWTGVDRIAIIGSGTDVFVREALANGVPADKLLCLGNADSSELIQSLLDSIQSDTRDCPSALMLGIGNVAGPGMRLANALAEETNWGKPQSEVTVVDATSDSRVWVLEAV